MDTKIFDLQMWVFIVAEKLKLKQSDKYVALSSHRI